MRLRSSCEQGVTVANADLTNNRVKLTELNILNDQLNLSSTLGLIFLYF